MFTGIVEALGIVKSITIEGSNKHFVIESSVSSEMKPDESLLRMSQEQGDLYQIILKYY